MNGMIANETIINKIAVALCGDEFNLLTRQERNIVRILKGAGWVTLEGEDKIVTMTNYGKKFS